MTTYRAAGEQLQLAIVSVVVGVAVWAYILATDGLPSAPAVFFGIVAAIVVLLPMVAALWTFRGLSRAPEVPVDAVPATGTEILVARVLPALALVIAPPALMGLAYQDFSVVPWLLSALCIAQASHALCKAGAIAAWERAHPARVLQIGRWWDRDRFVVAP